MKREFVLRSASGEGEALHFALRAPNQLHIPDSEPMTVSVLRRDENGFVVVLLGERVVSGFIDRQNGGVTITLDGRAKTYSLRDAAVDAMSLGLLQAKTQAGTSDVKSPIPGLIKALLVEPGATVAAGQALAILEAMKMENEIRAPHAGVIERVCAIAGQNVTAAALLFSIKHA